MIIKSTHMHVSSVDGINNIGMNRLYCLTLLLIYMNLIGSNVFESTFLEILKEGISSLHSMHCNLKYHRISRLLWPAWITEWTPSQGSINLVWLISLEKFSAQSIDQALCQETFILDCLQPFNEDYPGKSAATIQEIRDSQISPGKCVFAMTRCWHI